MDRIGDRAFDQADWEMDEIGNLDPSDGELLDEVRWASVRSKGAARRIGLRITNVLIHDNRRLFGESSVRMDALVVHGSKNGSSAPDFYSPVTFRFDRVADGDHLPIGDHGLLVYLGKPRYFLDFFLTVSRERDASPGLHDLLTGLSSPDIADPEAQLLSLATGIPDPDLLAGAMKGALLIGDAALMALRKATSGTIGLYRDSWLQKRDNWGIGRHPQEGEIRHKGLSFSFEILEEVV